MTWTNVLGVIVVAKSLKSWWKILQDKYNRPKDSPTSTSIYWGGDRFSYKQFDHVRGIIDPTVRGGRVEEYKEYCTKRMNNLKDLVLNDFIEILFFDRD